MASTSQGVTKSGRTFYKIQVSRGHGVTPYTRRWYPDPNWSKRTTERELSKAIREFEGDIAAGRVLSRKEQQEAAERAAEEARKDPLFADYAARYLQERREQYSPNTTRVYQDELKIHINPVLGETRLTDITPAMVEALLRGRLSSGASYESMLTTKRKLSAILIAAYKEEIIPRNVMDFVTVPQRNKNEAVNDEEKALTADELADILQAVEEEPLAWKTFFYTLFDTGLRRGEALALKWSSVDWKAATVTVSENWQYTSKETGSYICSPKTASSRRTVDIGPDTLQLLRELRQSQAVTGLSPFVFASPKDPSQPYTPGGANDFFQRLSQKTGIHIHPHKLRHTAATLSITEGADVASVSRRLGHSSISTTLGMYTHPDAQGVRKAGDLMRSAVDRATKKRQAEAK